MGRRRGEKRTVQEEVRGMGWGDRGKRVRKE
jgi:hypothetical protein